MTYPQAKINVRYRDEIPHRFSISVIGCKSQQGLHDPAFGQMVSLDAEDVGAFTAPSCHVPLSIIRTHYITIVPFCHNESPRILIA